MSKGSLYDTMGVGKDASHDEVRKAFRDKAKTEHPDAGGSAERFAALTQAHMVLSDPGKRARYDETGREERTDPYASAFNIVSNLLQEALVGQTEPTEFDLLKGMKAELAKGVVNLREKRRPFALAKDRATRMLGRFTGKKTIQIERLLRFHLEEIERQLQHIDDAIDDRSKAAEILSDVNFRWDDPEAPLREAWGQQMQAAQMQAFGTSTGTTAFR